MLEETAKETQAFVYETAARLEDELLEQDARTAASQVNEADKQAFIEASQPIYDEFGKRGRGWQGAGRPGAEPGRRVLSRMRPRRRRGRSDLRQEAPRRYAPCSTV